MKRIVCELIDNNVVAESFPTDDVIISCKRLEEREPGVEDSSMTVQLVCYCSVCG